MAKGLFINAQTGEQIERDLTDDEVAELAESETERIARLTQEAESGRRGAYITEADPLFFGWQRGENTEQAWLDKVAEIRDRYPYPS